MEDIPRTGTDMETEHHQQLPRRTAQRPPYTGLKPWGLALLLVGLLTSPGATQPQEGRRGTPVTTQARDITALPGPEARSSHQGREERPQGSDGTAAREHPVTRTEPIWSAAQHRLPPAYEGDRLLLSPIAPDAE
jgi:hypothetical protein